MTPYIETEQFREPPCMCGLCRGEDELDPQVDQLDEWLPQRTLLTQVPYAPEYDN